eukprot:m.788 g.788  ORF g.788 m.788 type:complete len:178 (-) comp297_c0_seq2:228-761(-)
MSGVKSKRRCCWLCFSQCKKPNNKVRQLLINRSTDGPHNTPISCSEITRFVPPVAITGPEVLTSSRHFVQQPTGWVCDVCKRAEPTSGRFRCSLGCDWDTCEDCLKKNLPTPQSCQGYTTKHEHKLAETDLATPWICDGGCGKKTAGLTRFRCTGGCDFDECSECVRKFDCREFSQS